MEKALKITRKYSCKIPNFHKKYIIKYNDSKSKKLSTCTSLHQLGILKFLESETSLKKITAEMAIELILG
jgi:hypothetical protein